MKLVAVAFLAVVMLCNSALAMGEGPVPFRALMRAAGAEAAVPSPGDGNDQSPALSGKPAHATHMTSTGKVMIGTGIGLVAIGGVAVIGTAALHSWIGSPHKAELYGVGGGAMAGGVILIVLGNHHRSAQ